MRASNITDTRTTASGGRGKHVCAVEIVSKNKVGEYWDKIRTQLFTTTGMRVTDAGVGKENGELDGFEIGVTVAPEENGFRGGVVTSLLALPVVTLPANGDDLLVAAVVVLGEARRGCAANAPPKETMRFQVR